MSFDIREYGAIGDGIVDDTMAIQKAIDECNKNGGGRVLFPSGMTFIAGPLKFKSNVELFMEGNSLLQASTDLTLYTESAFRDNYSEGSMWLSGEGCNNISISGTGTIDGQGTEFMENEEKTHYNYRFVDNIDMRPHLLTLIGCRNITIRDVTFQNAAYWCLHPVGCEDVLISGVRILNSLKLRNCDGIDADHCRNVRISDCYIESADDCICLKSRREYEDFGPTENVTVTGCTLVSTSCAIKLGSENVSGIRNVVFSSIIISRSNRALGIQNRDEGVIENVSFNNIIIESRLFADVWWGKSEPIYITAFKRDPSATRRFVPGQTEGKIGQVRRIQFNNISSDSENGVYLCGCEDSRISQISFKNVNLRIGRTTKYPAGLYDRRPCDVQGLVEEKTAGFFFEDGDDITVLDSSVEWKGSCDHYGEGVFQRRVTGLRIEDFEENRVEA